MTTLRYFSTNQHFGRISVSIFL